ncbi:MAG TPA: hypothetical protein GXX51_00125 [Firmicutes bacterium]|nr:hypothetical protein [Bacillota bacterium]
MTVVERLNANGSGYVGRPGYATPVVTPARGPEVTRGGPGAAAGTGGRIERFDSVLRAAVAEQGVRFSAHAEARMRLRNIRLSSQDMEKLNTAVARAAAKGAKESLVLMDRLALVVSIENRTVITAIDSASAKENVFTNIDSAVII